MTPATRAVLVETPTNPLMRITDLARDGRDRARAANALLIVDNTFASPYFQRPFEFGADIVYHSTTKYLNGHSDMIGGIAVVRDDDLADAAAVHPQRGRRGGRPVRCLARAARHQDAAPPHAPARRERPRRSRRGSPSGSARSA